jgi:hypothetical protein
MSAKKSKTRTVSRAAKRARFVSQEEKPNGASPAVLLAGLAVALALIGGAVFAWTRPSTAATASTAEASFQDLNSFTAGQDGQLVVAATSGHAPYPLVVAEDGAIPPLHL